MTAPWLPFGPSEHAALRDTLRARRPDQTWDLVVVGAGITGAGIARDAALRGLSVLVLDAKDIAFGTSSRSTRLIHGGVRYLEQGAFGLVFEALHERATLTASLPHLCAPTRFLFPSYRGNRLPVWLLRLGLTLYDALDLFRARPHAHLDPDGCVDLEPLLRREGLRGAVVYDDAVTDDARLTLTVLQDARTHGAHVLTQAPVARIARDDQQTTTCTLADGLTIRAKTVVVAAGPWTSPALLGDGMRAQVRLSRGIHVVLSRNDLPVRQPLVVQVPHSHRILFAVPWGARTYVGTTDTDYDGDPGACGVTPDDEDEVLKLVSAVLQPKAALHRGQVFSAWSGVRPLVADAHTQRTEDVSRRHLILETTQGVLAIVGGKLTTYRAMAEDVVDRVLHTQGIAVKDRPCKSQEQPFACALPAVDTDEVPANVLNDLRPRHGTLSHALARRHDRAQWARLVPDLPYLRLELQHAIAFEGALGVHDVLRRRLPLVLTAKDQGASVAPEVARLLTDARGGTQHDINRELDQFRMLVQQETGRDPVA